MEINESMEIAQTNISECINYLCNLKLQLVNGRMIKVEEEIKVEDINENKEITEIKNEMVDETLVQRNMKEILSEVCNLQLEISNGRAKKKLR